MHLFTYPVFNKLKACFNTLCATRCLAASKTINAKTICKISSTQKTIKLKTKKKEKKIYLQPTTKVVRLACEQTLLAGSSAPSKTFLKDHEEMSEDYWD